MNQRETATMLKWVRAGGGDPHRKEEARERSRPPLPLDL